MKTLFVDESSDLAANIFFGIKKIPQNLLEFLYHGKEETYLEYKSDVSWSDRKKKLEITQTIFALANERDGGIIVIGVGDDGKRVGLSQENFNSYSHDDLHKYLTGKGNQPIECKLEKFKHKEETEYKGFVFIQVAESKEFPVVYIAQTEKIDQNVNAFHTNIGTRKGALYIRNKQDVGNKEIESEREWQEVIERTYRKYERETVRRYVAIKGRDNPYDGELTI